MGTRVGALRLGDPHSCDVTATKTRATCGQGGVSYTWVLLSPLLLLLLRQRCILVRSASLGGEPENWGQGI